MGMFKPSGVAKDCDKAARILKAFIDNGKIPREAIVNAKGLAIFSGFRAGMYLAGAGGSGVVVARLPDGTWSPPSAFSVRSGSIGLVGGVAVYDCVCVLNTQAAVDAYTKPEVTLGGSVAVAVGPMNTSDVKDAKAVWTYTKSLGLYGGLTVDGTSIKANPDANEDFYGARKTTAQILEGEVEARAGAGNWPAGAKTLVEVLKMAAGEGVDVKVLGEISTEPTPGDLTQ